MNLRVKLPAVVLTAAVGLGLFAPASAPGSCAGPIIGLGTAPTLVGEERAVPSVRPGEAVAVRGSYFYDGCNDTIEDGQGCSAPKRVVEPASRAVDLTLTQDGTTWTLGSADAAGPDDRYQIAWDVTLPADLKPGAATLTARTAELVVSVD